MVVGGSLLAILPLQISIEKLQSKNKKISIYRYIAKLYVKMMCCEVSLTVVVVKV